MQEFRLVAGAAKILHIFIEDSRVDDGSGITGLAYNTSGLDSYYIQVGEAGETEISLATTTLGTWTSGGFLEIDSTNMPGWYELQLPEACCAPGFKQCSIVLKGAANMVTTNIRVIEEQKQSYCRYPNPADGFNV